MTSHRTVTTGDAQNTDAHRSIQSALVNTLWDTYRVSQYDDPDNEQWGVLTVSFGGTALFYIDRRDAPARPGRQR